MNGCINLMITVFSPFEQFKVVDIWSFNYNLIISNIAIQTAITLLLFMYAIYYLISNTVHLHNRSFFAYLCKELYIYIYKTIYTYIGKKTNIYFPYMSYIFIFILLFNLIGLLPFSFTITSNLSVTLGLGFMTWFGILLIGFNKWGDKYFALFCPHGSGVLLFILPPIEFISTLFRSISLALRLLSNIVAGHILLDCITFFAYKLLTISIAGSYMYIVGVILSIGMITILLAFEACVAFLQSYIFNILSCLYLKEVL